MSSSRTAEYRSLVEDVLAGGLLEVDEFMELRDMLARVERQILSKQPPATEESAA